MQDWKIVNSSKYTLSYCTYVFHRCRFVLAYSIPRYFRFPQAYLRFQSPRGQWCRRAGQRCVLAHLFTSACTHAHDTSTSTVAICYYYSLCGLTPPLDSGASTSTVAIYYNCIAAGGVAVHRAVSRYLIARWGAHQRHLANTSERSPRAAAMRPSVKLHRPLVRVVNRQMKQQIQPA